MHIGSVSLVNNEECYMFGKFENEMRRICIISGLDYRKNYIYRKTKIFYDFQLVIKTLFEKTIKHIDLFGSTNSKKEINEDDWFVFSHNCIGNSNIEDYISPYSDIEFDKCLENGYEYKNNNI